ncbi:MAG: ferrous iron transport protein A [Dehalococcoidales bacterium]|nr:ferrous iron transport protein A [Dehalococcoidales bacterium]
MSLKSLKDLNPGDTGEIVRIDGGHGMANRLYAMGIKPNTKITKISSGFMRGPVTVMVNRTQIAIGFGMANKILVEVKDPAK